MGRHLERRGLLERDAENGYLALEPEGEDALAPLLGSSITYRIALGPQQGRKAFTLRTVAPDPWAEESTARVARASGFSLHAGVLAEAGERAALPLHCAPGGGDPAALAHRSGAGALPAEDPATGRPGWALHDTEQWAR